MQAQHTPTVYKLYTTTTETPLHILRRCMLEGTYQPLVIEGAPPQEVIDAAGMTIYSEYCEAVGGIMMAHLLRTNARRDVLRAQSARILDALEQAEAIRAPEMAGLFKKDFPAGAKRVRDAATDDEYLQALTRIRSLIKRNSMEIARLEDEAPKDKQQRTPAEVDAEIDNVLIAAEEMMRREINDDINVAKYCAYVKKLRERSKAKSLSFSKERG